MSLYYSCDIYLSAPLNEETLLTLINRGKHLGFIYFNLQSYSGNLDIDTSMSSEEAFNYILMGKTTKKNDSDFPKCLTVKYLETILTLSFYEKDGCTNVSLFVLGNKWEKTINDKICFDFGRYVKLLIDLCEDFCIEKVETLID